MQGVFVEGRRPKTKKELKEAVADGKHVTLEATSLFDDEYDGPVVHMPEHDTANVVGPDPRVSRKWYANITRNGDKVVVR